jgi:nucleoside-diphosphate-sugar epimerase
MRIHILGGGPIAIEIKRKLSVKFPVESYSENTVINNINLYSDIDNLTFGEDDVVIFTWRSVPKLGSLKYRVFEIIRNNSNQNSLIINLSSVSVYGESKLLNSESSKTSPVNEYGSNKLYLENFLNSNLDSKLCHLRISNIFGSVKFDDIVNKLILAGVGKKSIQVIKPEHVIRDFLSLETLVAIICRIIEVHSQIVLPKIINIGSGNSMNLSSLISIIEEIIAKEINIVRVDVPFDVIRQSEIDIKILSKIFAIPKYSEIKLLKTYISEFSLLSAGSI